MSKNLNNFVVTAEGFVKEVIRKPIKNQGVNTYLETTVIYTKKLMHAKACSPKEAKLLIERCKLNGFVYNPYEEEPGDDKKWTVEKGGSMRIFGEEEDLESLETYRAVRHSGNKATDVTFLVERFRPPKKLYTQSDAQKMAIELNEKMIESLKKKVIEQQIEVAATKLKKFGL
jgi:hypothetical protein